MKRLLLSAAVIVPLWGSAAAAQSCLDVSVEEARTKAGELTTLLQIANFRGDVKYMSEVVPELESFLETCGDGPTGRLVQVCGYDCHLQLGRHRLFLASDLPYLSDAGVMSDSSALLSPQSAMENAEEGLRIVERGLSLLARQQAGDEEDAFRNYTFQLVGLNALKIRLHMAVGDAWYQAMSEARIKSLAFAVSDAIEVIPGAPLESQPNLHKANTQYEAAMWALIETQTDIPGETSYDTLRADIEELQNDLDRRLRSVRQGMIFLEIDPMAFTTIPFEELQTRLEQSKRDLETLEAQVKSMVREWAAGQENQATRAIDERRTIRGQQVNLLAHQIGTLEAEAAEFTTEVQADLNAVNAELDTFGRRQQIRTLEIQLATKLAEFQNRQRQIDGRQELDMIALSRDAAQDRRNELRWLLSFEMTLMNLDLQTSSIRSQIGEYDRQRERNLNQLEQISRQRVILQTRIDDAQNGILQANSQMARIGERQTDIFAASRAVAREDLCGIEDQLALIGDAPDTPFAPVLPGEQPCAIPNPGFTRVQYQSAMCGDGTAGNPGLRAKLFDQQIQGRAFLMKCVIGDADFSDLEPIVASSPVIESDISLDQQLASVDCQGFDQTETEFAKQVYEAEKAFQVKQRESYERQAQAIQDEIDRMRGAVSAFLNTTQGLQSLLTAAELTLAGLALIPETTVCVCGVASGADTKIDPAKAAAFTVEALRGALNQVIAFGQININIDNQVGRLDQQLLSINEGLEQLDFQTALKAHALHRAHFQLAGREAQGAQDLKELTLQSTMAAIDCEQGALGIDEQVARLKAQHKRILASMALQSRENDLLNYDITTQTSMIERFDNEIDILTLELEKLDLQSAQLVDDNARIEALIASAEGRITRIDQTRVAVTGLAAESRQETNVINELRARQQAAQLALSNDELAFVEARILAEQSNTERLAAELEGSIELVAQRTDLQESIRAFRAETQERVAAEREKMFDLVSQIDDENERNTLFLATQEQLSELMRGIPDYLSAKRRKVATANRVLHLMRQRYALVLGLTGQPADFPLTYVRDASQLDAMAEAVSDARFFNEKQIGIDVAQIVVPPESGFIRKLAQDEEVIFEISPYAATDEAMRDAGHFVLWDDKFATRRNMSLIDVLIGVQYDCTGAQWNKYLLSHQGSGSVFRPLAEGSTVVVPDTVIGPRRLSENLFYNLVDSQTDVNSVLQHWLAQRHLVRKFPSRSNPPPNDRDLVLPFLGAPVYGTYALSLKPSSCGYEGAAFTLYFLFASTS